MDSEFWPTPKPYVFPAGPCFAQGTGPQVHGIYLVDPASSHMLVSKVKPCMSKYKLLYGETANGSLKQL